MSETDLSESFPSYSSTFIPLPELTKALADVAKWKAIAEDMAALAVATAPDAATAEANFNAYLAAKESAGITSGV